MSEEKEAVNDLEKEKKVVISAEDCNAALDFWRHFNIPIPPELQASFDLFAKDPSYVNQQGVKLNICKAISESSHEAFKDDMFSKILEECSGVTYEMQFDKELEDTVTESK